MDGEPRVGDAADDCLERGWHYLGRHRTDGEGRWLEEQGMMPALLIFGSSAHWTPWETAVGIALLALLMAFGFGGERFVHWLGRPALPVKVFSSLLFGLPYLVIALADGVFRWRWLAVYAAVPVTVAVLLTIATRVDPEQRG